MSALVIKMSGTADNVSCNVKTLTAHAKFLKSYLIRYHEGHLMNDVMSVCGHVQSQDTLLCLNHRQLLADLLQSLI